MHKQIWACLSSQKVLLDDAGLEGTPAKDKGCIVGEVLRLHPSKAE